MRPARRRLRAGPVVPACLALALAVTSAAAQPATFEDFADPAAGTRWGYVADGVMGGVSRGGARIVTGEGAHVRLTGTVSTANNGGFVQVRRRLDAPWPEDVVAITLEARGNGERYYVFLRHRAARRVFHSYRAAFETGADWARPRLPLSAFAPSHDGMAPAIAPEDVAGIGLVAYGRDHEADLSVRWIGLERGGARR
jgi:hypothetical protein